MVSGMSAEEYGRWKAAWHAPYDDRCTNPYCGHLDSMHQVVVDDDTGREMWQCQVKDCDCHTLREP